MHLYGLFTTATSMQQLTDMVYSASVLLGSPCLGQNVQQHFHQIQEMFTQIEQHPDETEAGESVEVKHNFPNNITIIKPH